MKYISSTEVNREDLGNFLVDFIVLDVVDLQLLQLPTIL